MEHDSFAKNPGKSIGDDTCNNLKKLGIKKMPANCRFPDGIPVSRIDLKAAVNWIFEWITSLHLKQYQTISVYIIS